MKQIILLACITWFIGTNLSETDNFEIENGKLVWQKVIESDLDRSTLIQEIKSSGQFQNIQENQENVTAELNRLSPDFQGYGSSEMSTPIYVARNYVNAFVIFEFKEGRYRVTLKNIYLVQKYDDALSREGETTDLEAFALKKRNTEFKKSFLNKPSKIFDYTFQKVLTFKSKSDKDKW